MSLHEDDGDRTTEACERSLAEMSLAELAAMERAACAAVAVEEPAKPAKKAKSKGAVQQGDKSPAHGWGWSTEDIARLTDADLERARRVQLEMRAELREYQRTARREARCVGTVIICPNSRQIGGGEADGFGGLTGPALAALRPRAGRSDRGMRRHPQPTIHQPASDLPTVGTDNNCPNTAVAVLPAGVLDVLPSCDEPVLRAALVDVVHTLAAPTLAGRPASEDDVYMCLNAEAQRDRYGRPTVDGRRMWAWDYARDTLLGLGVIEVETSASGKALYIKGKRSKAYRLTERWRSAAPTLVERGPDLWVPPAERGAPARDDGSTALIDDWWSACLARARFDLPAAVADILAWVGAEPCPADAPWETLRGAVAEASPSQATLDEVEAKRRRKDKRPADEIARAKALGQLLHVVAWQRYGHSYMYRDPAGLRLHTPITSLASRLRGYLSFEDEAGGLSVIDAANSQMVFLAAAALEATKADDALEFRDVCAAGMFYERSYELLHGTTPSPAQRKAWKPRVMGSVLYARQHVQERSREALAFESRWPSVSRWMLAQKDTGTRDLPCLMQRRESAVWIDALGPELARRGIVAVSVHDSVIVPTRYAAEVSALLHELYRASGLKAKLELKPLRDSVG